MFGWLAAAVLLARPLVVAERHAESGQVETK
jgi:hypothetical protein